MRCGRLLGWADAWARDITSSSSTSPWRCPTTPGEAVAGRRRRRGGLGPVGRGAFGAARRRDGGVPAHPRRDRLTRGRAPGPRRRHAPRAPEGWAGGGRAEAGWAVPGAGPARGPGRRPDAPQSAVPPRRDRGGRRASPCAAPGSPPPRRAAPSTRPRPRRGHGGAGGFGQPDGQFRRERGRRVPGLGRDPEGVGDPAAVEGGDDASQPRLAQRGHRCLQRLAATCPPTRGLRRRG